MKTTKNSPPPVIFQPVVASTANSSPPVNFQPVVLTTTTSTANSPPVIFQPLGNSPQQFRAGPVINQSLLMNSPQQFRTGPVINQSLGNSPQQLRSSFPPPPPVINQPLVSAAAPTPLVLLHSNNSNNHHFVDESSNPPGTPACCASCFCENGKTNHHHLNHQNNNLNHSNSSSTGNNSMIWNLYQQLNCQENDAIQKILLEGTCPAMNFEILNESLKKIESILKEKSDAIRQYMSIEENPAAAAEMKPKNLPSNSPNQNHIIVPQIRPVSDELPGFSKTPNSGSPLIIEDQPYGNVVANKYLEPPLRVKVSEDFNLLAKEGSLQVTAVLCGSLTENRINRTSDGKQNILQGYTILPITPEGYATFNKLKIMDVSSKHHHQPFSIQLQLQEIKKSSVVNIGDPIKSSPLRVQSRINKKGNSRSNLFNVKSKKKARTDLDCNYIDITSLLVLPQKEAASKLGISESMLCKRFKECTRRKWPYRYLRKIDKMLQMFSPKNGGGYFANGTEDEEKIERLKREREECLQPVKIRITGNDKVSVKLQSMIISNKHHSTGDVFMSETESEEGSFISSSQDQNEEEVEIHSFEDDELISQVAETLNSLKQSPTPTTTVAV